MIKFDREGTFLCGITEHTVSETSNGFPQWVVMLEVQHYWDEDAEKWVDFSECDMGGPGYFCLFGANEKATANVKQIMKATEWDGKSILELPALDFSGTQILVRVKEETYLDDTKLKVSWVDHKDADPIRSLSSCSTDVLKAFDAKYASALAETKTKAPAKAPAKSSAKKSDVKKTSTPKKDAKTSAPKVGDTKKSPPKPPTPPKKSDDTAEPETVWTSELAWDDVYDKCVTAGGASDDELSKNWLAAIEEASDGKGEDALDSAGWDVVRANMLQKFDLVPF